LRDKVERKGVSVIAIVILIIVIAVVGVGAYFLLKGGGGAFGDAYIAGLLDENGNLTANGGTTTQRIQYIKGTATNPQAGQAALTAMAMSLSSQTTFNGKIYLKFNGSDEEIPAYDDGTHEDATAGDGIWTFKEARVLMSGTNTFQITVKNLAGDIIAQSEVFTVNADIPVMDIWIQLTWDTDQTDVDLHVWDPHENHTYFGQKIVVTGGIPGAELDVDDVDGYGPEHFTMQSAQAGNYVVKVRYYSAHGVIENTTATVRLSIAGGAYHTYTHTFTPNDVTTETDYDTTYGYDWHVATLLMTDTGGGTVTAGS
jgi:uncharacterized protein YfaP (DUF2135 family)